ncbi:MAG: LTA synthase family protein, partial [Crocinitomicaceae bacterium]
YEGQNVVIIIMESFSVEYIGALNESGSTYTPFLDDLISHSLSFTNAYANGKKSLDAVPAILASVPKLMEDEYLLSNYSVNQLHALPEIMNEMGYSSSFFHGATNGSMNFDSFCEMIGFQNYYGRTEYNNEADYDGTWGIYDEEFLDWTKQKMNSQKQPFFDVIFTISNHPPYDIPKKYEDKFKNAPSKKHRAVMYADYALETFFEKIKNESWFNNTLFVLTADHTPGTDDPLYSTDLGKVHIPLLFYHANDSGLTGTKDRVIGQIDIMPTILDLVGYKKPYFSFGHSAFHYQRGYTSMLIADKYLHFGDFHGEPWMISFQNESIVQLSKINNTVIESVDIQNHQDVALKLEQQLKAMIQAYNHALLTNSMTIEQ